MQNGCYIYEIKEKVKLRLDRLVLILSEKIKLKKVNKYVVF